MSGIDKVMNKLKQSKKDEKEIEKTPKEKQKKKITKPIKEEEPEETEDEDEEEVDEPEEMEQEEAEDGGGEVSNVDEEKAEEDLKKARAKEIEILQNNGVFRVELLYRLDQLNKNLTIHNGLMIKAFDIKDPEEENEEEDE